MLRLDGYSAARINFPLIFCWFAKSDCVDGEPPLDFRARMFGFERMVCEVMHVLLTVLGSSSDYCVRDVLILKPFRKGRKHSQKTLWQLRLRHLLSASRSASDYGLPALRPRKRANGSVQW